MNIVDSKTVKKRVTISVLSQVANQLFVGLCGVVVLKVMTNDLGTRSYGLYVTIVTFVSTFALLTDLGLNVITAREIVKHPNNTKEILSNNMGLRLFLCIVAIPVISGVGLIFYPHASNELRLGILLMSCYLIFDSIWATSGSYFASKVRSDVSAVISTIQQSLFLLCAVGVAVIGWGLFGFLSSYVLTIAIGSGLYLWKVRKYVNIRAWRSILGMSITLGVISIINVLYLKADSIMISVILGTTAVGIYGVAYSLVNVFLYLSGYLMGALTPSLAVSKGEEFSQIVQKAFHFMIIFACLLAVGGFFVRHDIVLLVSSEKFTNAASPFAILAFASVFSYVNSVFGYASVAVNKHHKFIYVSAATLFLNVCINLIFIPRYGMAGAAWATVISEFLAMVMGYYLFRKQTGVKLNFMIVVKPMLAALVSLAFGLILSNYVKTDSALLNCLIKGTLISGPYILLLYVTGGLPSEMKDVINKGMRLITARIA
jgi:O-antigen/teichoic acid export membrane protein